MVNRPIRVLSKLGIMAAAVGMTGAARPPVKPFVVYHDSANILFTPEVTGSRRLAKFGPWELGERLSATDDPPRDKRLNLYVVLPGGQYRSPEHPEYNHNRVVNKYLLDSKPRDWDIFWCLVLDPSLHADLRGERELLTAFRQGFRPGESFKIHDAPASAFLAEKLSLTTMDGLRRFRRKDGSLPRLLIVPAHLALRATATREPAGPPAPQ
ncbi:MAG TPA: hypothetical protein VI488_10900 [Candidatus Angelobacter sp.]